jgi:hypothetical protein
LLRTWSEPIYDGGKSVGRDLFIYVGKSRTIYKYKDVPTGPPLLGSKNLLWSTPLDGDVVILTVRAVGSLNLRKHYVAASTETALHLLDARTGKQLGRAR